MDLFLKNAGWIDIEVCLDKCQEYSSWTLRVCWHWMIGNGRRWGNPPCSTKPTTCAQRRLGSAWASAKSDQSLRCPHEENLGPWLPFERTAKTDQNPDPIGALLKHDVHYVLVVCNPDPLGQGTFLGLSAIFWSQHHPHSVVEPRTWGFWLSCPNNQGNFTFACQDLSRPFCRALIVRMFPQC